MSTIDNKNRFGSPTHVNGNTPEPRKEKAFSLKSKIKNIIKRLTDPSNITQKTYAKIRCVFKVALCVVFPPAILFFAFKYLLKKNQQRTNQSSDNSTVTVPPKKNAPPLKHHPIQKKSSTSPKKIKKTRIAIHKTIDLNQLKSKCENDKNMHSQTRKIINDILNNEQFKSHPAQFLAVGFKKIEDPSVKNRYFVKLALDFFAKELLITTRPLPTHEEFKSNVSKFTQQPGLTPETIKLLNDCIHCEKFKANPVIYIADLVETRRKIVNQNFCPTDAALNFLRIQYSLHNAI